MGDRRFARRVQKDEPVEIRRRDPAGGEERLAARLQDLSRSGACLLSDHPVRMASSIALVFQGREVAASVRYCKRQQHRFLIGVEFEDPPA